MELIRLSWSRLRHDARRSLATFLALAMAVTSFVVLVASTQTQQLQVAETASQNFRAAYDILVRPSGSSLGLEKSEGLVRSNYLSGTFGGLTLDQVASIKRLPGVEVAAPIAMVGYYYQSIPITVDAEKWLAGDGRSLLRWQSSMTARNQTAKADGPGGYLYRTRNDLVFPEGEFTVDPGTTVLAGPVEMVDGQPRNPCPMLRPTMDDSAISSPFDDDLLWEAGRCQSSGGARFGDEGRVTVRVAYPMLIAAIDPQAEADLVGLDSAVYDGRYLTPSDGPLSHEVGEGRAEEGVPVLLAGTQQVDYQVRITIDSLPESTVAQLGTTVDPDLNRTLVNQATGTNVYDETIDAAALYRERIASTSVDEPWYETSLGSETTALRTAQFWRPADVRYQEGAPLRPVTATRDDEVWRSTFISSNGGFEVIPFTTQDTGYRPITTYVMGSNERGTSEGTLLGFDLVGKFDPAKIDEFSELSAVPLETYTSPELTGADDASRQALGGKPMRSDLSIGGYLQQTPTLLMSLEGLKAFSSDRVVGLDGASKTTFDDSAPISAIRVRVAGVTGMDQASRQKITDVATAIEQATGADVDITIGSSPETLQVALPATTLASPAVLLNEPWTRKGIAYTLVAAIDVKSLLLFSLILISSGLTVAISAGAAVRGRRRELGILASLGWTSARRSASILTELAMLGVGAGITGAAASWPLAIAAGARFDWPRALASIPAALLLALLAGAGSAWRAGRLQPIDAIRPAELAGGRRLFRVRGGISLGLHRILRRPGRLLLGAAAVALAVTPMIVLLALVASFRGQVVGTLLGDAIAVQVRSQDLVAGTFLAILGLTAVAMVLYLNVVEDARMYASLQSLGWRNSRLASSLTTQALTMGLLGAGVGAAVGLWITRWLTGTIPHHVLTLTATVVAATALATIVAALAPALALRSIPTARLLATE